MCNFVRSLKKTGLYLDNTFIPYSNIAFIKEEKDKICVGLKKDTVKYNGYDVNNVSSFYFYQNVSKITRHCFFLKFMKRFTEYTHLA